MVLLLVSSSHTDDCEKEDVSGTSIFSLIQPITELLNIGSVIGKRRQVSAGRIKINRT